MSTRIGNRVGGPGGNIVSPPQWMDIKFPATGQQLDTAAGRIDYDYAELGIGYQNNTLYPSDSVGIVAQMNHNWVLGDIIKPHLHWAQNQDKQPNWLLEYRYYKNGEPVPSVWTKSTSASVFTYTSGTIMQVSRFDDIDLSSIDVVSAIIDFKIYRDTTDVSGEFGKVDDYVGTVLYKEFDIHVRVDAAGSRLEFVK